MQTILKALTRLLLRILFKPFAGPPLPLAFQRRWIGALTRSVGRAEGVQQAELRAGEVPVMRLRAGGDELIGAVEHSQRDAILYVHGGAFVLGGGTAYLGLASRIAAATGADVYLPDYRLAPEHPYPAPADDVFAAYEAILRFGHHPGRTAIVADSAGGALAVGTALALPEMDVPSPAAMSLMSPWLDLSLSGASIADNARRDPMLRRAFLEEGGRAHAGTMRRSDPRISPLFADLAGLPPTLVQVGSDEVLLDDSVRFADRAWAAGVEIELQRFDGLWHDFQSAAGTLAVARGAIEDMAAFLARRLDATAE